jgi:hypothetical protein
MAHMQSSCCCRRQSQGSQPSQANRRPVGGAIDGLDVDGPAGDAAYDTFRVQKMRFGKATAEQKAAGGKADPKMIVYDDRTTLSAVRTHCAGFWPARVPSGRAQHSPAPGV